ncbi:HesA/MoeB/ThiF family protein [Parasediminibacterium sp. JCM 36343]|uniref:HesA/MoeB/ThiF family protein n=1 Tax=Parasediminibacterium sp. JCM 36343 TaxID=3374279 RepID=UPI003978938A
MIDTARYLSQIVVPNVGSKGQQAIQQAKILVVGAGGLGCPVITYLTAMGIGIIGIVDDDIVRIGNLHRQVLYSEVQVGQLKVFAAKEKLNAQNATVNILPFNTRLTQENAAALIEPFDIIIDCTDNTPTRYIIDEVTYNLQKPWVYAAVLQQEGQVAVFNYQNGLRYSHVFADESVFAKQDNCAIAGIMGYTTGIVGCLQVNETIKIILGSNNTLNGFVLSIDLQTLVMRKWKIKH